jgi:hypothetical protein
MLFVFVKHHKGLVLVIVDDGILNGVLWVLTVRLKPRLDKLIEIDLLIGVANVIQDIINLILYPGVSLQLRQLLTVHQLDHAVILRFGFLCQIGSNPFDSFVLE